MGWRMAAIVSTFAGALHAAALTTNLSFVVAPVSTTVGAVWTNITVQLSDSRGSNILKAGIPVTLTLLKGAGLGGVTNLLTDAQGKAVSPRLFILQAGNGLQLQATSPGLRSISSSGFKISPAVATNVLVLATNSIFYGQTITLSARVGSTTGLAPTGKVTFRDGSVVLGESSLVGSQATLTVTNRLAPGNHSLSALYSGDTNFNAVTSAGVGLWVERQPLIVTGIVASNKVYDAKTTAALNLSGAALVGVLPGDMFTLITTNARGSFSSKAVGTNKVVSISGLQVSGSNLSNYVFSQPTTTANITPALLAVTLRGVNKSYDATTNAAVTCIDNRLAGDALSISYSAAWFTNRNVGTNKSIFVSGITVTGPDSANYLRVPSNGVAAANITAARLVVGANSFARPFGVTNPPLTYSFTGFVGGETAASNLVGVPAISTTATITSTPGNYPIVITKGTLGATNYSFAFANGMLTVSPVATEATLTSGLNPARTNQNILFQTRVRSVNSGAPVPSGLVRLKANGTNVIASGVALTNGITTLAIPASQIASGSSVMVTAEFADPAGNFSSSSNSFTQTILVVPPSLGQINVLPPQTDGTFQAAFAGTPGQTFIVEASADLQNWTPISTNVADANGRVLIIQSNALAFPSRFFRGVLPPPVN